MISKKYYIRSYQCDDEAHYNFFADSIAFSEKYFCPNEDFSGREYRYFYYKSDNIKKYIIEDNVRKALGFFHYFKFCGPSCEISFGRFPTTKTGVGIAIAGVGLLFAVEILKMKTIYMFINQENNSSIRIAEAFGSTVWSHINPDFTGNKRLVCYRWSINNYPPNILVRMLKRSNVYNITPCGLTILIK
jgi:hypothetical protein